MADQTVEDLGKLVIQKYPDAYGKMDPIEVGRKVRTKFPEAYGQFKDVPSGFTEKAKSLLFSGNVSTPPSQITPQKQEKELQGVQQFTDKYLPPKVQMGLSLAEPAMAIAKNPAGAVNFAKSAYQGVKAAAPKLFGGGALAAGGAAAESATEGISHLPSYARYIAMYPGLRMMGQGLKEGAQQFMAGFSPASMENFLKSAATDPEAFVGKVAAPAAEEATKLKGPSLGSMKEAVRSGNMTLEQFDQQASQLGLSPEALQIERSNLLSKMSPKGNVVPGETPKTMSVGDLKMAVKHGLMDLDEFENELTTLGYNERSRGLMRRLLEKAIEEGKEEEATAVASPVKPKVETPVKETPKVDSPIKSVQVPKAKAPKGTTKIVGKPGTMAELYDKQLSELPDAPSQTLQVSHPNTPKEAQPLSEGLKEVREQRKLDLPPQPERAEGQSSKLTGEAAERAQSPARAVKEKQLSEYLAKSDKNLDELKPTPEMLKALGKEAGLKYKPSLRTFEAALKKARALRNTPGS